MTCSRDQGTTSRESAIIAMLDAGKTQHQVAAALIVSRSHDSAGALRLERRTKMREDWQRAARQGSIDLLRALQRVHPEHCGGGVMTNATDLVAPSIAVQSLAALQSPALAALIGHRLAHFSKGHDARSDDDTSYRNMLCNLDRHFLQPIFNRTDGHRTAAEITAAATAATKAAALFLAIADKANRHAARVSAEAQESAARDAAQQQGDAT